MFLNVIVPSYNRLNILAQNLEALSNQSLSKDKYKIILVDDGSTDGTDKFIELNAWKYINLIFIRHEKNMGLAATRNTGIKLVKEGIIIFLDADIVVENDFIETHLNQYKKHANESISVVSNVMYPDSFIQHSNFAKYVQSRNLGCRSKRELSTIDLANLPSKYFAGGASSLMYEALSKVGMFDDKIKTYGGEDDEFGWRLHCSGVRIIYCDKAIAWHFDEISIDRYKKKIIETARNGYRIIFDKNKNQIKSTNIRYLLPINISDDKIFIIATKFLLKLFYNYIFTFALEVWIRKTDFLPKLYFVPLYKILCGWWFYKGLRMNIKPNSDVW